MNIEITSGIIHHHLAARQKKGSTVTMTANGLSALALLLATATAAVKKIRQANVAREARPPHLSGTLRHIKPRDIIRIILIAAQDIL